MESHLESLIGYFVDHPELALGVVFAAAVLEAVAVIGTVVPGSLIVFAGGVLVGLKALDPWLTCAVAITGAIIGDGLSYWLGHRYHEAIRSMWPMRNHPALFERGEAYFAAHGGKSVFFGRFLGPLRAVVPVIAGMLNMPAAQFYTMNILSAIAWAVSHLLPGVLFGASLELAGAVSSRLLALFAVLVVGLWLVAQIVRLALRLGGPYVRMIRNRIVAHARRRPGWMANLVLPLVDPARPESLSLLVAATLLIGGAWLFIGVVESFVRSDMLMQVDHSIYEWLQTTRTGWSDDIMVTIAALGSAYVTVAVIVAVSLWLLATRRWRTLAYWIAAVSFAELFVWVLTFGFERARPDARHAGVDPYTFPSGHAALCIVVYGFLAFLLAHRKPGWQKLAITMPALAVALLITFARLYLGAHAFSDVAASLGLGLAWIGLLCIAYLNHVRERPLRAVPMLVIVTTTLAFFGSAYAHRYHDRDLQRYARAVTTRTIDFERWKSGEWRRLPQVRSELRGRGEEPFSAQWAASADEVAAVLAASGWRRPPPWRSRVSLLWLLPSTPLDELPVLPKLHQGQPPALTFVRPVDARNRLVIRLWRIANVSDGATTSRPLWAAVVTAEQARAEFGLIATARTTKDIATPLRAVEEAVRDRHVSVETRTGSDAPVLLIW